MTQRLNLPPLDAHKIEEEKARLTGDAASERTSFYARRFVPDGITVIVPSSWYIVAPQDFEIGLDGELELEVDAILEIL